MVCLITGAAGMMGTHLYESLLQYGEKVIATYYNPTIDSRDPILSHLKNNHIELDLTDYDRVKCVINKFKPSVIYHLAAQSRPDISFNDPYLTLDVNIGGTTNLLKACASIDGYKPLIINASSSAVYGDINWLSPPTENCATNPLSPYGTSKLAQEHLVRNFYQMGYIDYVNVRIFNCTGPRKINDFVSDMCRRVVNQEFPIKVGNLTGRRSIIDVRDMVSGLIKCSNIKNDTLNLGSSIVYDIDEVFKMIVGDCDYIQDRILFRVTDEPIIYGNINKAVSRLDWSQKIDLEKTINDTLDYWNRL